MDIDVMNAYRTIEKHGFNGLGEKEMEYIKNSIEKAYKKEKDRKSRERIEKIIGVEFNKEFDFDFGKIRLLGLNKVAKAKIAEISMSMDMKVKKVIIKSDGELFSMDFGFFEKGLLPNEKAYRTHEDRGMEMGI